MAKLTDKELSVLLTSAISLIGTKGKKPSQLTEKQRLNKIRIFLIAARAYSDKKLPLDDIHNQIKQLITL